jgi:hypothetical protein
MDAQLVLDVRWRGGALDRMLDEDHAALVGEVSRRLVAAGWDVHIEVTYSHFGERGSFDILAFMPGEKIVLVIEVKTYLASTETTFRKLDEKTRLASRVASARFGWQARSIGRLLVLDDTSTARRRVARHARLFDSALPLRGHAVRRWISQPSGPASGIWFLSASSGRAAIRGAGGRDRVRSAKSPPASTTGAF